MTVGLIAATVMGSVTGLSLVAHTTDHGRAVRDSKQRNGPLLTVSREGRQAFLRRLP
ncbi:DUF397 domain-containing protein [Streptomyces kebangsaanensis]|uniref:DUF397 domain-containing protein n=1 Tax=Streptomyces kebangsaanensis TaxID=864058 RepID=A0ABW6KUT4_9ACTN